MLNNVANFEWVSFVKNMPDPLEALTHIIFNMSLARNMLFRVTYYL
jgi:hypothetical protein